MTRIAYQVIGEVGNTNHTIRKAYANAFLNNPDSVINSLVGSFVFRTNVMGSITTPVFDNRGSVLVQSAITDAAMDSQLATDWDSLAGV